MKDSKSPKKDSPWQKTHFANLVRYNPSGTYYARVRIKGKLHKKSLETTSITVAKMKLGDFVKEGRALSDRISGRAVQKMTFGDALELYRANGFRPLIPKKKKDLVRLKPRATAYYQERVKALLKAWPDLERQPIASITTEHLNKWSAKFLSTRSATGHNHTLGMLRNVFDIAVERGAAYVNPARQIMRATEKPKKLILPTREQFELFVKEIEGNGAGKQRHCANLVRFLAYGGFRLSEAANVTWADCDFQKDQIRVVGDPETGTKGTLEKIRNVDMIGEMREFLKALRARRAGEALSEKVMRVNECQKAMDAAASEIGMQRITHHDLRHLFATRCIESGVDIPTVSRWLGHQDGGALCMRVYGHVANDHSRAQARKVSFSSSQPANVVAMPARAA